MASLKVYDEFGGAYTPHGAVSRLSVEAARWLETVNLAAQNKKPGEKLGLFSLLRGSGKQHATDRTVAVLNQARSLISAVFPFTLSRASSQGQDSTSPAKASAAMHLYQTCLHQVLLLALEAIAGSHVVESLEGLTPKTRDSTVGTVLDQTDSLSGLVNACVEVVTFAALSSPAESFPCKTLKMGRSLHGLELLQGLSWLKRCRKPDTGLPEFPPELDRYICAMEVRILEELAFVPGSTFFTRIAELGAFSRTNANTANLTYSSPNAILLASFISRMGKLAGQRVGEVCAALARSSGLAEKNKAKGQRVGAALAGAATALVDSMLHAHLDMMVGRHLTVVVLGGIYCTAKLHGVQLRFQSLNAAATACLPAHDAATLDDTPITPLFSIKLYSEDEDGEGSDDGWSDGDGARDGSGGAGSQPPIVGSAREFYNKVFLPAVRSHELSALFGDTAAELEAAVAAFPSEVVLDRPATNGGRPGAAAGTDSPASHPSATAVDGSGGVRRPKAKKPTARTPLASLRQPTKTQQRH